MQYGRISTGLHHAGHTTRTIEETLGPCARLVVQVPIKCGCKSQAVRDRQAERMNVAQDNHKSRELLSAGCDAKLGRLLYRIDCVCPGIGEAYDLGLG